jgi:hypothetical protein
MLLLLLIVGFLLLAPLRLIGRVVFRIALIIGGVIMLIAFCATVSEQPKPKPVMHSQS